jgi:hypothetical protein
VPGLVTACCVPGEGPTRRIALPHWCHGSCEEPIVSSPPRAAHRVAARCSLAVGAVATAAAGGEACTATAAAAAAAAACVSSTSGLGRHGAQCPTARAGSARCARCVSTCAPVRCRMRRRCGCAHTTHALLTSTCVCVCASLVLNAPKTTRRAGLPGSAGVGLQPAQGAPPRPHRPHAHGRQRA